MASLYGLTEAAAERVQEAFDIGATTFAMRHWRFYWLRAAATLAVEVLVRHTIKLRHLTVHAGFVESLCSLSSTGANSLPEFADLLDRYSSIVRSCTQTNLGLPSIDTGLDRSCGLRWNVSGAPLAGSPPVGETLLPVMDRDDFYAAITTLDLRGRMEKLLQGDPIDVRLGFTTIDSTHEPCFGADSDNSPPAECGGQNCKIQWNRGPRDWGVWFHSL
jgi:hypothetical protein